MTKWVDLPGDLGCYTKGEVQKPKAQSISKILILAEFPVVVAAIAFVISIEYCGKTVAHKTQQRHPGAHVWDMPQPSNYTPVLPTILAADLVNSPCRMAESDT